MQHLFSPEGDAALAAVVRRHPLLAFDFDGTLAPIVARPSDARISQAVAGQLARLALELPVAVVTGRQVGDVRERLGFSPRFIVGSHGAEDEFDLEAQAGRARALNPMRERLHAWSDRFQAAGVLVEDKQQSIALHYRLARDRRRAYELIHEALSPPDAALRVFHGKRVVNLMAADAPDKAHAVRSLLARCEAKTLIFAGDDVNDEPVFESARPDWLTIRVGRDDPHSRARFFLDSTNEMATLLQRILALLRQSDPR